MNVQALKLANIMIGKHCFRYHPIKTLKGLFSKAKGIFFSFGIDLSLLNAYKFFHIIFVI